MIRELRDYLAVACDDYDYLTQQLQALIVESELLPDNPNQETLDRADELKSAIGQVTEARLKLLALVDKKVTR